MSQFEDQHDYLVQCETNRRRFSTHCRVYENLCQSIIEHLTTNIVFVDDLEKFYEDLLRDQDQMNVQREQLNEFYENLDGETRSKYLNEYFDFERRSNEIQEKLFLRIRRFEEFFRQYQEYQLRFEHFQKELNEIEQILDLPRISFEQRIERLNLYKDLKQKFLNMDSELIHLHDEIVILHRDNPMIEIHPDFQWKFSQLNEQIHQEFQR